MATYIIMSRFSPEAFTDPEDFKELAAAVTSRIKEACPGVRWIASYATIGRFDVVDIVESKDHMQVERASMIIRGIGHSSTETLMGTPWEDFLGML